MIFFILLILPRILSLSRCLFSPVVILECFLLFAWVVRAFIKLQIIVRVVFTLYNNRSRCRRVYAINTLRHSIFIHNCEYTATYVCVRDVRTCAALFTFARLLWFSHFLYLVEKKILSFFISVRPTNRSEHFLTIVVVVVVAKSSTWILHQHKGNARTILQSVHHTELCVCACVCLQVNVFFAALLVFVSRILSYRIASYRIVFSDFLVV